MEHSPVVPTMKPRWLAIGAVVVLLALVLRVGWVTEDAYITLRTVDNWVNGYGLRWNVDERVQSYTRPLWMLLLSAAYFVTRESFATTIFVGLLTTAAAALTLVHFARTAGHAVVAIALLTFQWCRDQRELPERRAGAVLDHPLLHARVSNRDFAAALAS